MLQLFGGMWCAAGGAGAEHLLSGRGGQSRAGRTWAGAFKTCSLHFRSRPTLQPPHAACDYFRTKYGRYRTIYARESSCDALCAVNMARESLAMSPKACM